MNINRARVLSCLAGASVALFAMGATAADLAAPQEAPTAYEALSTKSPWQIRVRALGVITNDSGSIDQAPGVGLEYSDSVVPELDITYYFTENFAAELILGTTYAKIKTDGLGDLDVGKAWLLPPTLMLQYHFTDFGAFKPYVGAGVNYSLFYNQSDRAGFTGLDVEDNFGAALQVGFDYMLDEHWGINFDVKKIFLETDWKVDNNALTNGPLSGKAKIDPWLIGAGVTYRF
ncbi:outer membrane beta-barrel protein [Rhizobiales bacterium RZME27]|uniref:Outer membrane beta-barrel protein n=1 Tax=Endobacterium cereale TaxID=2663029 RepID=A0A6A8AG44_9HYPH|nr:OmpW family protein [Endobacterium cereale]MEB2845595.1 OmpW family protein [Endobacterium cereale]MQY48777.1 outer membrane beta-barrel protein [Endobacterium cereale]